MNQPPIHSEPHETLWQQVRKRRAIPSWAVSVAIHLILLLILGLAFRSVPQGAGDEADRSTGIVLVKNSDGKREYFDGETDSDSQDDSTTDSTSESGLNQGKAEVESEFNPSESLPGTNIKGPGPMGNEANGNPDTATKGDAPRRTASGGAITNVFGVEGEGHKFVYVFDRSTSMGEHESKEPAPLAVAKKHLLSSIESLDRVHQFQIIFFNSEQPTEFNPTGQKGRLVYANQQNKELANRWVQAIKASGGTTKAQEALLRAIAMKPNVIFFLTDADNLNHGLLQFVTRNNRRRASINVIQFGDGVEGAQAGTRAMLRAFAKKNSGQYVYVAKKDFK